VKALAQGLVCCLWDNYRAILKKKNLGHIQVLKSHNKEFFPVVNYFLNNVVARQTINVG
jgi:hypothetical protein